MKFSAGVLVGREKGFAHVNFETSERSALAVYPCKPPRPSHHSIAFDPQAWQASLNFHCLITSPIAGTFV